MHSSLIDVRAESMTPSRWNRTDRGEPPAATLAVRVGALADRSSVEIDRSSLARTGALARRLGSPP
jgi:hypothetical protein